jgi:hypothetical protein
MTEDPRTNLASLYRELMDDPLRTIHVNVRLKGPWRTEWRQVMAHDLQEASRLAEMMPDVKQVYETSFVPGGVIT